MALPPQKALVLCGGLQSSGTTLVSYCFLQRGDTDGVLDADNDLLPALDLRLANPVAWYKTTISCFRLSEIAQHYRDAGWDVRTLLVLRDLARCGDRCERSRMAAMELRPRTRRCGFESGGSSTTGGAPGDGTTL